MNSDEAKLEFVSAMTHSSLDQKHYLLCLLAHNLTVSVRGVRAEDEEADAKLEKLYALNEIQHRLTSRLMSLRLKTDEWTENSFISLLFETAQEGYCEADLLIALKYTLKANKA